MKKIVVLLLGLTFLLIIRKYAYGETTASHEQFKFIPVSTGEIEPTEILATKEQALHIIFGRDVKIISKKISLDATEIKSIKQNLGGTLIYIPPEYGPQWGVKFVKDPTMYVAYKGNKEIGIAFVDTEPGRWGPIELMISLNPEGNVKKVVVMRYREEKGRPIAQNRWLNQFIGKSSKSSLELGKDIIGVGGATFSSDAATFAVKKILKMYEMLNKE